MKELVRKITDFLKDKPEKRVVSVECNGQKLKTEQGKPYFFLHDIERDFGSVERFALEIKDGYMGGDITLKEIYNGRQINRNKITIIGSGMERTTQTNQRQEQTTQRQEQNIKGQFLASPQVGGYLGYVQVPANAMIESGIRSERYTDLEGRYKKLESDYLDVKSENRILKEENSKLKIDLATKDREKELDLKKAEMDRKGFFDTVAGQEVMKGLGSALPALAQGLMGAGAAQAGASAGLAGAELSEVKTAFINMVANPQVSDQMVEQWYNLIANNARQ